MGTRYVISFFSLKLMIAVDDTQNHHFEAKRNCQSVEWKYHETQALTLRDSQGTIQEHYLKEVANAWLDAQPKIFSSQLTGKLVELWTSECKGKVT